VPVQHTEGLGSSLETAPSKPPSTPTPPVHTPTVRIPAPVQPLPTLPAAAGVVATQQRVGQRRSKPIATRPAAKRHTAHPPQLPALVGGSVAMPAFVRAPVAAAPVAIHQRDLRPAALALLALIVTSGCLLAVAARYRQDGLGG